MYNRRLIILPGLLLVCHFSFGQAIFPEDGQRLTIGSKAEYASSALTFLNAATSWANGRLSADIIGEIDSRIQRKNQLFYQRTEGLILSGIGKNNELFSGWHWGFRLERTGFAYLNASDDQLSLFLYGNGEFEGERISLNNLRLSNFTYESLGMSLEKRLNTGNGSRMHLYGSLSLAVGERLIDLQTGPSSFYTAPYAEFLTANLDYEINRTPQSGFFSGIGLSFNGSASYQKGIMTYGLQIEQLGFLHWLSSEQASFNDSLYFDGIEFANNELGGIGDERSFQNQIDSLENLIQPNYNRHGKTSRLPGAMRLSAACKISENLTVHTQLSHYFIYWQTIGIQLIGSYKVNNMFRVNMALNNGPYGGLGFGGGLSASMNKFDFCLSGRGLINLSPESIPLTQYNLQIGYALFD